MGELESIQTGRAWQFQCLQPLVPLLAAQLGGQKDDLALPLSDAPSPSFEQQ